MKVICTYCSESKNKLLVKSPAIQIYKSLRISAIYKIANDLGVPFFILSGKHGLLKADELIYNYDYLLRPEKVNDHALKVAEQLKIKKIKNLIFFTKSISIDLNIKPYLDCIKKATSEAKVVIELKNYL